jgi:hypothetical protein
MSRNNSVYAITQYSQKNERWLTDSFEHSKECPHNDQSGEVLADSGEGKYHSPACDAIDGNRQTCLFLEYWSTYLNARYFAMGRRWIRRFVGYSQSRLASCLERLSEVKEGYYIAI